MEEEDPFLHSGDIGSDSDGEEVDDERAHSKLLDAISSLDGKPRSRRVQRTEAVAKASEFHASSGKDKVRLHELVGALRTNTNLGELKKQLNRVQKKKRVLSTPLAKHEQEKIQRNLAYEATSKEVTKWDSIVQKNRKADQLFFPLEQPSLKLITSDQFVKRFTPHTSLETEVAALLQGSAHTQLPKEKELTDAEEKALKALSIEEAQERRAELQKYRALLSYKEAKARRQNKIKSKKYHRILRKEKSKLQQKSLEELSRTDPEAFAEKMQKLDTDRMKERMSLKHRGASKLMANQKLFAKYDNNARQAVQEMNQKSRQLTQKVAVESESEEEEVEEETMEEQLEPTTTSNPWMAAMRVKKPAQATPPQARSTKETTRVAQTQMAESGGDSDSEEMQNLEATNIDDIFEAVEKRRSLRARGFAVGKIIEDSSDDSDEEAGDNNVAPEVIEPELISVSLKRKQTMEEFEAEWSDSDNEGGERPTTLEQQPAEPSDLPVVPVEKDVQVDPKKFFTVETKIKSAYQPELLTNEEGESEDDQRMTIAEAFATDDVVDEFLSEKQEVAERDKPKDIDLSLPGWGEWAGTGLQPSKRKKKRFTLKAPAAPRKDRNLDNVIISETKDTAISKHQVSDLPFPFTNVQQFESSVRAPIGKTWNPETAYRELIKQKVVTKLGTVITPIDKETAFKKQQKGQRRQQADMEIGDSGDGDGKPQGGRRKRGGQNVKRRKNAK